MANVFRYAIEIDGVRYLVRVVPGGWRFLKCGLRGQVLARYLVSWDGDGLRCNCPGFPQSRRGCKHARAIEVLSAPLSLPPDTTPPGSVLVAAA